MTRITLMRRGREIELGTYPAGVTEGFRRYWRSSCPNRHYKFYPA